MMSVTRTLWAMALLTPPTSLLLACGNEGDSEAGSPVWHLEEVDRMGSLDGEGSALSEVADIVLTDSTVLILEASPSRVAVFSREGRWLRDIGRPGEGPGEFEYPLELGVFEGKVWVGDLNGVRLELFTPDGGTAGSYRWSVPRDSLNEVAVPTAMLADGSVLASPRRVISVSTRHRPYYRVAPNGEVVGVLYRRPAAEGDVFTAALPGGRVAIGLHPLPRSPLVGILPNGRGLVVVERPQPSEPASASFTVKVIDVDGTQSTEFHVPYEPMPADGWLEDFAQRTEQSDRERVGSVDGEALAAVVESLNPRSYYPPVSGVVGGIDGSIWIRREELILADSVRWQVFDADGDMVGTFAAPQDLRILLPSLDEVWGVEPGELDVPFVVRLRVTS